MRVLKPTFLRLILRHANSLPQPTRAGLGRPFSLVAHLSHLGSRFGARWGLHHVSLGASMLVELLLQHAVLERAWHGREGGVWLGD
jgi:hypothetical protein